MIYSLRTLPRLIPLVIFVISAILGGIAGTIPVFALMSTIACALAFQLKINPIRLVPFAIFGSMAGAVTPVSMNGVLVASLAAQSGIPFDGLSCFLANFVFDFIPCFIFYFAAKWHKFQFADTVQVNKGEKFERRQVITLIGSLVMIVLTVFCAVDVGLASLFVAAVVLLLGVTDQKTAISGVPWGTLIMISGMGILISVVNELHGIDLIADLLTSIMTPAVAPLVYVLLGGFMSLVASAQGVVMPTLFPTIPALVTAFPTLDPQIMMMATLIGAYCTSISPFSTGGALVLGAYSTIGAPSVEERDKLFLHLIYAAFIPLALMAAMAGLGFLKVFF